MPVTADASTIGLWTLDEASGAFADSSTSAVPLTAGGTVTRGQGWIGRGIILAASGWLSGTPATAQRDAFLAGIWTLEAWLKLDSAWAAAGTVFAIHGTGSANETSAANALGLIRVQADRRVGIYWETGAGTDRTYAAAAMAQLPLNEWFKLTVRIDLPTGTMEVWKNRAVAATLSSPGGYTPMPDGGASSLIFVGQTGDGTERFRGGIDHLRLSSSFRSSAEIEAAYDSDIEGQPAGNTLAPVRLWGAERGSPALYDVDAYFLGQYVPEPVVVEPDVIAPVIDNFSPAPGEPVTPTTPIGFDVHDETVLATVFVYARFPSLDVWEVVHDGQEFNPKYSQASTRESLELEEGSGWHFEVLRNSGWPEAPTFSIEPVDSQGNIVREGDVMAADVLVDPPIAGLAAETVQEALEAVQAQLSEPPPAIESSPGDFHVQGALTVDTLATTQELYSVAGITTDTNVIAGNDVRASRVLTCGAKATVDFPAASSVDAGSILFDTTQGLLKVSNGTAWSVLGGVVEPLTLGQVLTSNVVSGSNAFAMAQGARLAAGAGHLSWDGSQWVMGSGGLGAGLHIGDGVVTGRGLTSQDTATVTGMMPNGSGSIAIVLRSELAYSTVGSKLVSVRNVNTEQAYFNHNGALFITGPTAGGTDPAIDIPWNTRLRSVRPGVGTAEMYYDGFKWLLASPEGLHMGGKQISAVAMLTSYTAITVVGAGGSSATAVGTVVGNTNQFTHAGSKLLSVRNGNVTVTTNEVAHVDRDGKLAFQSTDSSATPGDVTINKPQGSVAIAAAASSATVTNSCVAAGSVVLCTVAGAADATLTSVTVRVPAAGSFIVTGNAAATAAVKVNFVVMG